MKFNIAPQLEWKWPERDEKCKLHGKNNQTTIKHWSPFSY